MFLKTLSSFCMKALNQILGKIPSTRITFMEDLTFFLRIISCFIKIKEVWERIKKDKTFINEKIGVDIHNAFIHPIKVFVLLEYVFEENIFYQRDLRLFILGNEKGDVFLGVERFALQSTVENPVTWIEIIASEIDGVSKNPKELPLSTVWFLQSIFSCLDRDQENFVENLIF